MYYLSKRFVTELSSMRNCKYKNLYAKVCLKINIMFKYILLKYTVLEATEFTFFTLPKHFSFHKMCEDFNFLIDHCNHYTF